MGKKVRSVWSYLAYFTVAISLSLLSMAIHNFIFFGWGLLIFIATTSMFVTYLLQPAPRPKIMRKKVRGEIIIMTILSLGYLAEAKHSDILSWLLAGILFMVLLFSFVLYLVKRKQGKMREREQQASK